MTQEGRRVLFFCSFPFLLSSSTSRSYLASSPARARTDLHVYTAGQSETSLLHVERNQRLRKLTACRQGAFHQSPTLCVLDRGDIQRYHHRRNDTTSHFLIGGQHRRDASSTIETSPYSRNSTCAVLRLQYTVLYSVDIYPVATLSHNTGYRAGGGSMWVIK